jgi:DNA-binding FadR family transcriptional regulator
MGEVAIGAMLPSEKELVSQLGVSRATLREALRMLETEGLIATKPGPKGGIVVRRPGSANLTRSLSLLLQLEETPFEETLEARRLLEPMCANLAAQRASAEEVAQLQQHIEIMRQNIGNVDNYVAAQLDFHLGVIAAAHNAVLRLYTISVGEIISSQTTSVGLTQDEQLLGVKAAESILSAIVSKNGSLAARRTESHLRSFEVILLEKLSNG